MIPALTLKNLCCLLTIVLRLVTHVLAGSQFTSHVSVNTPKQSFMHGVGNPLLALGKRSNHHERRARVSLRSLRQPTRSANSFDGGYPRMKPEIIFDEEEVSHDNTILPWQYDSYMEVAIPVLPPSPYKVDSPDPESLWPAGLFLPPLRPPRFGSTFGRRADTGEVLSESESLDHYLLEGSEAIAAVEKATLHGHLYFHEVPHINSLLANQEIRVKNQLKPHRIASIRHTWPYNRP